MALRAQAGREFLRSRAEGYGRPIISTMWQGQRVVAVNSAIYRGNWNFFTDFLIHHLRLLIDSDATTPLAEATPDHPLVQWQGHVNAEWHEHVEKTGRSTLASKSSSSAALLRLAYALYLIAHNDQLPKGLITRLRNPRLFRPAVLETFVAAAFIVAGYRLQMSELRPGSTPEPEFTVIANSGQKFSVEAKRKDMWAASPATMDSAFEKELATFVRRKLRDCVDKKLPSPVYWLELSIPGALSSGQVTSLLQRVRATIRDAETTIVMDGVVPAPGYVFISSHGFLADGGDNASFIFLDGFHIPFVEFDGRNVDEALGDRDRHRDATWILKCARDVQNVPHAFDGTPDALLGASAQPIDRLAVGQELEVQLPDGSSERGIVKFVFASRATACAALIRGDGSEVVVQVPLTADEHRAFAALGDTAFGQPKNRFEIPPDDPLAIYDFLLETYRGATREQLIQHLGTESDVQALRSLEDLRRFVSRRYAKEFLSRWQHRTVVGRPERPGCAPT